MNDHQLSLDRRQLLRLLGAGFFSMGLSVDKMRDARSAVDHLLLGVPDREMGIAWLETKTGVKAMIGGSHPGRGTCNALISFGARQYLEILAPDPAQQTLVPQYEFLRELKTPRLITWAASIENAETAAANFRTAGFEVGGPSPGSRRRPDGGMMTWKSMSVTSDLGLIIPFFIEWDAGVIHPSTDSPLGCRLAGVELSHPKAKEVSETLKRLGINAKVSNASEVRIRATLDSPKGKIDLT
jgi:hypothetical protein